MDLAPMFQVESTKSEVKVAVHMPAHYTILHVQLYIFKECLVKFSKAANMCHMLRHKFDELF